jgi:hypothetical protein
MATSSLQTAQACLQANSMYVEFEVHCPSLAHFSQLASSSTQDADEFDVDGADVIFTGTDKHALQETGQFSIIKSEFASQSPSMAHFSQESFRSMHTRGGCVAIGTSVSSMHSPHDFGQFPNIYCGLESHSPTAAQLEHCGFTSVQPLTPAHWPHACLQFKNI